MELSRLPLTGSEEVLDSFAEPVSEEAEAVDAAEESDVFWPGRDPDIWEGVGAVLPHPDKNAPIKRDEAIYEIILFPDLRI